MTWNLFSLTLAAATGWAVLAIGFLPVTVLRREGREAVKAAGAWAIVAATAPAAVYHWYLIFALICLVAWTKLERPVGKIVLAVAAALGLSLGVVFPLEAVPGAIVLENPLALASLYLGGAAAGIAYGLSVVARALDSTRRPAGFARALVAVIILWIALLGATTRWHGHMSRPLALSGGFDVSVAVGGWTPLVPAVALLALVWFALGATERNSLEKARRLAGVASALAFGTSLFAQFVLR
jgi:hypothetical protein